MPIHDWTRVDAGIFHHFHLGFIFSCSKLLNAGVLPPQYYALSEQVAGGLIPDVLALERIEPGDDKMAGGVAVATAPPKVQFTFSADAPLYADRRYRVAIRHRSDDKVVAIMELVSPGNKDSRNALRSFVDKAVELLYAGIHLLVVDLFPPGRRDPNGIHAAIWSEIGDDEFVLPVGRPLTLASYAASQSIRAFVEPVAVGSTLPSMPLYLTPTWHVPVPLEQSYADAYEAFPLRWREEIEP